MFEGVHTALVTPFRDGNLDKDSLRKLVDAQIAAGVKGLVPVGTTGESPTLDYTEHHDVIKTVIDHTEGRVHVIAGTGSNSTKEAIEMTQSAEKAGATGALLVCPYYNRPSQEGLFQHYRAIAESTELPLILYSIPGRCGIEIGIETTGRLAETCSNIVAMKEAGGNPERVSQLIQATPEKFEILSGDDSLTLPFLSVGAVGLISVASNVIPSVMSEMVDAALTGNYAKATKLHRLYYPLFNAFLKLDTNPVPVKTALAMTGAIGGELRLPLANMAEDKAAELRKIMTELGLL